jgi:hypothetical protein
VILIVEEDARRGAVEIFVLAACARPKKEEESEYRMAEGHGNEKLSRGLLRPDFPKSHFANMRVGVETGRCLALVLSTYLHRACVGEGTTETFFDESVVLSHTSKLYLGALYLMYETSLLVARENCLS